MLEKVIKRKYYLEKHHLQAPMLAEREAYISQLFHQGLSRQYLLSIADYLLRIVEFLNLSDDEPFRKVSIKEIETAGEMWSKTIKNHPMKRATAQTSQQKFILTAINWLGPQGRILRYAMDDNILSGLFSRRYHKCRYLTLPLLEERVAYLAYWSNRGATHFTLKKIACYQLHIIEYLTLTALRPITESEILVAAKKWEEVTILAVHKKAGRKYNYLSFISIARGWFDYMGLYIPEPNLPKGYEYIKSYLEYLIIDKGYSERTEEWRDSLLKIFFRYLENEKIMLKDVSAQTIDNYLEKRGLDGCGRRAVAGNASVLRDFFRYAEEQGWCRPGIQASIRAPRCYKMETLPSYITWDNVNEMLSHHDDTSRTGKRDHAILKLLSVYGLRCSEVTSLKLKDIDWRREVIYLKRAKGCRPQEMPLVKSVGDAIIRYLKEVRNNDCSSDNIFLCTRAPYESIGTSTVYNIVRRELEKCNVNIKHYGPHTLRHSCATHLVNSGHSMKEVADLLGHQILETTRIYAKVDLASLRKVSDMNWEGIL